MAKPKTDKENKLTPASTIRYRENEDKLLTDLEIMTGLNRTEIIHRLINYGFQKRKDIFGTEIKERLNRLIELNK